MEGDRGHWQIYDREKLRYIQKGCGARRRQRAYGDTEGREVLIRCVHIVREGQNGGFTVGVNVAGTWEPLKEQATGARKEMVLATRALRVGELWKASLS